MQIRHTLPLWEQRPDEIQKAIDEQFNKLARSTGNWNLYNGASEYLLANVKERLLIKKIIEEGYKNRQQREFYLLDIGAGEFCWPDAMADYLNNELNVSDDVVIHIIGVRAEKNLKEQTFSKGKCRIYNFGEFKLENMIAEFDKHQLRLENQVDFIVTRACFQHLVDPVGTFAQAYELLRPQTGYFTFSDFSNFVINDVENNSMIKSNHSQISLMLLEANIDFLLFGSTREAYKNDFIIQKRNTEPCKINLSYSHRSENGKCDAASSFATVFTPLDQDKRIFLDEVIFTRDNDVWNGSDFYDKNIFKEDVEEDEIEPRRVYGMYGCKSMHEFFKQNKFLIEQNYNWYSIYEDKRDQVHSFKMHEAIIKADESEVLSCLDKTNINESDYNGNTPVHLAIQGNHFEIFKLLLTHKPHLDLFNNDGRDALMEAIKCDKNGRYISALIAEGVSLNPGKRFYRDNLKPLDYAKNEANPIAVKLISEGYERYGFFKVAKEPTLYQQKPDAQIIPDFT